MSKSFYDNLDQQEKSMLRNRFLDGKAESDLDNNDYTHMKSMSVIVYPEMCGNDRSKDLEDIYIIHNPNPEWV